MNDAIHRFFGGSPPAVILRLILLSIVVGVVLAALGFDASNLLPRLTRLIQHVWDMGFDAIVWAWNYFLLGALLVVPIWLVARILRAPAERRPQQLDRKSEIP